MGSVLSGLSLLMALALAGLLIALSRRGVNRVNGVNGANRPGGRPRSRNGQWTAMGYALNFTVAAAALLVSGLIGFRLSGRERLFSGTRWSGDVIWWQVWMGLAAACVALYFWRRGLRELRSNVYVPELAGHDASAPPSRRIERR